MKDSNNFVIVLLLITAVILGSLVASAYLGTSQQAYAGGGASVRGSIYVLGIGSWQPSLDLVYVLDNATRKINVYFLDINKNNIGLIDTADIDRVMSGN